MSEPIFIGIDPGNSGGVAWTDGTLYGAFKIKGTETDLVDAFDELDLGNSVAMLEKVSAMPGQGVTSMFTFGRSYGFLRSMLICRGVAFHDVQPKAWQKSFGLSKKFKSSTDRKNAHKQMAQQLFPKVNVTHGLADALLIAEHCRITLK